MGHPKIWRVGIIGCGKHVRRSHIAVWGDRFRLAAVYDPSAESLAALRQLIDHDPVVCPSPEKLVERDDVDVVMIGSLDPDHAGQLALAVDAGKPTMCDKPLATTAAEIALLERTLYTAGQKGLVVASCHPRRDRNNRDLAYGWIKANFDRLTEQFGPLERIGLHSVYPRPSQPEKHSSFLIDKFVHDIDFLRFLLGDLAFTAERFDDSPDHYCVSGYIHQKDRIVSFYCESTRLHGGEDEYIEYVSLSFRYGTCMVYIRTGEVRYHDHRDDDKWTDTDSIRKMDKAGYDLVFSGLMRDFADTLDGKAPLHSPDELLVINESAVMLAGPARAYQYGM